MTTKLGTPVSGIISAVHVDRGDTIKAGQIVAELDSRLERANVDLARARVDNDFQVKSNLARMEFLARKLLRQETLRAGNIVTAATFDETATDLKVAEMAAGDAKANLEIARQELRRAQEMVDQRRIVSPIDGVVVERAMSVGEYRNEQSHILVIAQIDPLNVEVYAPIARYGEIRVGDSATVMPEDPVGGRFAATVTVVDRIFDAASGTFGVRLTLPNPDNALPAGLRCRIRFDKDALRTGSGGSGASPPG